MPGRSSVLTPIVMAALAATSVGLPAAGPQETKPPAASQPAPQAPPASSKTTGAKPVYFVFHGGSGSPQHQIREAIGYGAIKMNIDTDLQWAFWEGVLGNYKKNEAYLQGQLGNPEGEDKPNKKYYDPRVWLRKGEESFVKRLEVAFEDLNCINRNA